MKKFSKILALLMAVVMVAGIVSVTCFATDNTTFMTVLGDSIASGYGLEDTSKSYATLISAEKSYDHINEAVPGYTTTDLLNQVKTTDSVRQSIKESDLIAISIGGNDIIRLLQNADLMTLLDIMQNGTEAKAVKTAVATATSNLENLYTELRSLNAEAVIIFQTQYNPLYANEQYKSYAAIADNLAPAYAELFNALAESREKVYIADVYTAFDQYYEEEGSYDVIHPDGIHPSEKGHALIAEVLLDLIAELEEQGILPTEPAVTRKYLIGDADGSGKITISDATTIQKYLASLTTFSTEADELAADSDRSGGITIKDATETQKFLAGLLSQTEINTYVEY